MCSKDFVDDIFDDLPEPCLPPNPTEESSSSISPAAVAPPCNDAKQTGSLWSWAAAVSKKAEKTRKAIEQEAKRAVQDFKDVGEVVRVGMGESVQSTKTAADHFKTEASKRTSQFRDGAKKQLFSPTKEDGVSWSN